MKTQTTGLRLRAARWLLAVLTAAAPGVVGDIQAQQPQPARQVHVWIIGVPEFSIRQYNSETLKLAVEQRCADVEKFFRDRLKENVAIHRYCTKEQTTKAVIDGLFQFDIPQASDRTLSLVFMMSHGEVARFRNDLTKTDLQFIASDTTADDWTAEDDVQRMKSSLLVGTNLLPRLGLASAGSTILTFLDTCHSGAAASISSNLNAAIRQEFGMRGLVFASSLPSTTAYRALFTKSLLTKFGTQGCLNQDTLPDDIQKLIASEVNLKPDEGIPQLIERYNGPLCLGNFGRDRRLLFLYGGHTAAERPFHYVLQEVGRTPPPLMAENLRYAYQPIPLDAKQYHLEITRAGMQKPLVLNIDLKASSSVALWLDDPRNASLAEVARFAESMAEDAVRAGTAPLEAARLRTLAAGARLVAGKLGLPLGRGDLWASYPLATTAEDPSNPSGPAVPVWDLSDPMQKAADLKSKGEFTAAAEFYRLQALRSTNANQKHLLATEAYYAYGAIGNQAEAQEVRKEFALSPTTLKLVSSDKLIGSNRAVSLIKALGIEILTSEPEK